MQRFANSLAADVTLLVGTAIYKVSLFAERWWLCSKPRILQIYALSAYWSTFYPIFVFGFKD